MSIKKDNEMMARLYTEARVDFDPDKMKFPDPIPEEGDMSNVSVRKKEYSWGALVVIEKGHDFSIVLHPEQQKQVRELKAGDKAVFKDETGTQYTVSRGDGLYNFVGDNGTKLSVDDRDLTRKLWSDIGFGEGGVEDAETPAQLERVEKGTIFFDDSLEIYKATMKGEHPEYTFMGNVNPHAEMVTSPFHKLQHKFRGWRDAHIATGEVIAEVGYSDAVDHSAWYIVGNDFPQDNSFKVKIK